MKNWRIYFKVCPGQKKQPYVIFQADWITTDSNNNLLLVERDGGKEVTTAMFSEWSHVMETEYSQ